MAVYKVPQDVEAEDKLLGPFSFKQFIFLIIMVMALALAWGLSQLLLPLGIIPLPIALFFGALALPLRKDQPMEIYLAAVISFITRPKKRLWRPDGVESLIEVVAPRQEAAQPVKQYDQAEVQKRLSYLATLVDSRGWSVRGVHDPNSSMQTDLYNEAQTAHDVLDNENSTSQQIGSLISQADARRRQEMIARMQQPAPTAPTPPANTASQPAAEPQLVINPYPSMHQSVVAPLADQPAPADPAPQIAPTTPAPSLTTVSPAIMDLASNHSDLSVETLQREANRLERQAKASEEEVVISLR